MAVEFRRLHELLIVLWQMTTESIGQQLSRRSVARRSLQFNRNTFNSNIFNRTAADFKASIVCRHV